MALGMVLSSASIALAQEEDPAPDVADMNFLTGLRGSSGQYVNYFAHKDNDGDGIPDIFQAGLLQYMLATKRYDKELSGIQDCCDKIWLPWNKFTEISVFYMGTSEWGRDFFVDWISGMGLYADVFDDPFYAPSEYSMNGYGLVGGADNPDADGLTNYQEFTRACRKFNLDGQNFENWSDKDWGVAYINNTSTVGASVMGTFVDQATTPSLPVMGFFGMGATSLAMAWIGIRRVSSRRRKHQ